MNSEVTIPLSPSLFLSLSLSLSLPPSYSLIFSPCIHPLSSLPLPASHFYFTQTIEFHKLVYTHSHFFLPRCEAVNLRKGDYGITSRLDDVCAGQTLFVEHLDWIILFLSPVFCFPSFCRGGSGRRWNVEPHFDERERDLLALMELQHNLILARSHLNQIQLYFSFT